MTAPRDPWRWIATMPSTNLRIAVSIVCTIGTAGRVVSLGWDPPAAWLAFLAAMAAIDAGQFVGKRLTNTPTPPTSAPEGGGGG